MSVKRWQNRFIFLMAATLLSSCSLFRFTVSMGDKPLSQQDLNTRVMVRGFYNEFVRGVINAADSIACESSLTGVKINALLWKMRSTAACSDAVFGSIPQISLLNTWALCYRTNAMFRNFPDSVLFYEHTFIAKKTSGYLLEQISSLARRVLPADQYLKMDTFVTTYSDHNPMTDLSFVPADLSIQWIESNGNPNINGVGSISEVVADMNDRITGYALQTGNELSWGGELIGLKMKNDGLDREITGKIDSISSSFNRMVVVAENSPQLFHEMMKVFNQQMNVFMSNIDVNINNAFDNFENQRLALQDFFEVQRDTMLLHLEKNVDNAVNNAISALPALIGKILIYIVLAFVILFSLPLYIGYLLGKMSSRKQQQKLKKDE